MARNRRTTAWLALFAGLCFLGLKPIAPVERALDVLLAPLGLASELGGPLLLLNSRAVAAAERELAGAARAEAAEGAELLARLAARALPTEPALSAGRRFVPAEVRERPSADECWVSVAGAERVPRGAPVVCGDVYAGRVVETRAASGGGLLARVELVTSASFRVGAEIRGDAPRGDAAPADAAGDDAARDDAARGDEPVYLTVGGVRAQRPGAARVVRLAAHQPSSGSVSGGLVRVHELFADADDSGGLAEGFRLGELRREGEREPPWVVPELDYLDGLFQLAIVLAETSEPPAARAPPALEDRRWLRTRARTGGDPSPWRSTLKVPIGAEHGVSAGAAVTGAGARLVGRVLRAGLASSDVALLADPGLSLTAIARVEGSDEPRVLGRVASLGRASGGAIRLRWWARVALELGAGDAAESVRARLFTGSGEPNLPGGLFLGVAELPRSVAAGEELELLLDPLGEPADARTLFVRLDSAETRP